MKNKTSKDDVIDLMSKIEILQEITENPIKGIQKAKKYFYQGIPKSKSDPILFMVERDKDLTDLTEDELKSLKRKTDKLFTEVATLHIDFKSLIPVLKKVSKFTTI